MNEMKITQIDERKFTPSSMISMNTSSPPSSNVMPFSVSAYSSSSSSAASCPVSLTASSSSSSSSSASLLTSSSSLNLPQTTITTTTDEEQLQFISKKSDTGTDDDLYAWTIDDQNLLNSICHAYESIYADNATTNNNDSPNKKFQHQLSSGKNNPNVTQSGDHSQQNSGEFVIKSIVDSHVTGFLTKFDDVEQEDIQHARALYMTTFHDLAYLIEPAITRLVKFAKQIQGFDTLEADDQIRLLSGCCIDLITLRAAYCISRSAKIQGLVDNNSWMIRSSTTSTTTTTPSSIPTSSSLLATSNQTTTTTTTNLSHQYNTITPPHIPNNYYPKLGTSDEKCAQLIRGVALKMARLNIDQTDVAMMAAILLMSPDRSDLLDVDTIENNQNNLLETFNRHVNRTRGPLKQSSTTTTTTYPISSSQCWPRIIMTLTELRSVTMCAQDLFSQTPGTMMNGLNQLPWYFQELFLANEDV
ncbi:unnamed protein product [Schistosoma turkestanicum]|nr:unnamed protein product [Schistosoma turkestanicum]